MMAGKKTVPLTIDTAFDCAYCGEENALVVDVAAGERQELVEDCRVCCGPNHLVIRVVGLDDEEPGVEVDVERDDE